MNLAWVKASLVYALLLCFLLGSVGCAAVDCSSESFGIERLGQLETFKNTPQRKAASLLKVDGPLNGSPPEVSNLRRGIFSYWVGASINDGVSSWTVIDLDEQELIKVSTRVWDKRARLSRPFDVLQPVSDTSNQIVRTWVAADGSRYERQVVMRTKLTGREISRFVCIANAEWRATDKPPTIMLMQSDTLESAMFLRWWNPETSTVQEKSVINQAQLDALIYQFSAENRSSK